MPPTAKAFYGIDMHTGKEGPVEKYPTPDELWQQTFEAARNPIFKDPVFKVGQSSRPPMARISELSSSTAVYRAFELVYFVHVSNRDIGEGFVQNALKQYRINPNKEFFEAPLSEVVFALDEAARQLPIYIGRGKNTRIIQQALGQISVRCEICSGVFGARQILIPYRTSYQFCGQLVTVTGSAQ